MKTNITNEELDRFLVEDLPGFLSETKPLQIAEQCSDISLDTTDSVSKIMEVFLEKGSSVLDTMSMYCNNMPDAECVTSLAALLNALTSTIDSISNIYKTEQLHKNKIELEDIKHQHKLKELEFRENLKRSVTGDNIIGEEPEELVEFNTNDIINQILDLESK